MTTATNTAVKAWDPFDKYRCRDPRVKDLDLFFDQVNKPHKLRNPKNIRAAELQRRRQNAIEAQEVKDELEEINTRTMDIFTGIVIGGFASFVAVCVGLFLAMM